MAVASFVISVLAFLVAGAALWYSHRQAVAAEKSADADERAVALAEAEAAKYTPPWVLHWEKGDSYLLTNASDEPTLDVKIDLGDVYMSRGELEHERIGPGSAIKIIAARSLATVDDTVIITWRRVADGPLLDWKRPLPAKPKF